MTETEGMTTAAMTAAAEAPDARGDHVIEQGWAEYADLDHAIWRRLFERQSKLLPGRACGEYLHGLRDLGVAADGIPNFERLSEILDRATGWRIVAVPGLVPDEVFFQHLAERRFPATNWIRRPEQMDYLQEPDVFHDLFGHVPLLMSPVFADYLQAYGRGGLKALGLGALKNLSRLYWYTVEFGLIKREEGLRVSKMNGTQQEMMMAIISEYITGIRDDVAADKMAQVQEKGLANFHFAWGGGTERFSKHYYGIEPFTTRDSH